MNTKLPVLLFSSVSMLAMADERPNIVMIYVDDMGYGDLSCYGGKFIETPNIDRLAEKGIRFTEYYTSATVSSPSRVGLTTGRYPITQGINTFLQTRKGNRQCEQKDYLASEAQSMARAFQQAGYATGHFGKWHMGGGRDVDNAPTITQYGFDEYTSTWESPDPDPLITSSDWIWADPDSIKRWDRTGYFVDKSIDFIERNPDKPFFINLWPDDVHTPWVPDELSASQKRTWETEETFIPVLKILDDEIGRFIEALEKMNRINNTIIVFTSDNGPAPSFRQERTQGMRGIKGSNYQGGIRMPMMIRWDAKINPQQLDTTSLICAIDFYPSLCKMAGVKPEKKVQFDGCDMSKALTGKKALNRNKLLFWDFGRNDFYNYPKKDTYQRSPHLAVRDGDWKLLCNGNGSDVQLYNLKQDRNETTNIADQHPEITAKLKRAVLNWWNENKIYGAIE